MPREKPVEHGGVIENKDYHERQEGRYQSWLQLSYALSNGKVLVRTYGVYSDGEGDLYGTSVYCTDCSMERLEELMR